MPSSQRSPSGCRPPAARCARATTPAGGIARPVTSPLGQAGRSPAFAGSGHPGSKVPATHCRQREGPSAPGARAVLGAKQCPSPTGTPSENTPPGWPDSAWPASCSRPSRSPLPRCAADSCDRTIYAAQSCGGAAASACTGTAPELRPVGAPAVLGRFGASGALVALCSFDVPAGSSRRGLPAWRSAVPRRRGVDQVHRVTAWGLLAVGLPASTALAKGGHQPRASSAASWGLSLHRR